MVSDKKLKSIERRFNRLFKECEKENLIIVPVGDGGCFCAYNYDVFTDGDFDQIFGLKLNGEVVEPIFDLNAISIY